MAAKLISLSPDDVTYTALPGSQGDISRNGAVVDDTVFGQNYRSQFSTTLDWQIGANAIYKGFAGYVGKLKKMGASTVMTGEATTLVSTRVYQITNTAKRLMDRATVPTILDGVTDVTAQVESVDFLFGIIYFKSTYTVVGAITITGKYFPTVQLGAIRGFTLTQTAATIDEGDYDAVQANGGYKIMAPGLQDVSLSVQGVYNSTYDMIALLESRAEMLIEINPDGQEWNGSIARGFFRPTSDKLSGNVGALEQEDISFTLSVPNQNSGPAVTQPFGWKHHANSPIPTAIKSAIDAWGVSDLFVRYLPDGVNGWEGAGVVTNISMQSAMDGLNTFTVAIMGNGALAAYP